MTSISGYQGPSVLLQSKLKEIIPFIDSNELSGIEGATGSGKSISIPAGLFIQTGKKVYVALPRRALINSLRRSQNIFNPALNVGILDEEYEEIEGMDIVYATSDILRKKIIGGIVDGKLYNMDFCDYLILDEIHVGNADNYIIIGLWKLFKASGFRVPKLVIMSATISDERYREFNILRIIDVNPYDIEIVYHNTDYNVNDNRIYNDITNVVSKYHVALKDNPGSFLIFVPGRKEIEKVSVGLSKLENVKIIQVHSTTIKVAMEEIYSNRTNVGVRKIIVATNIFETSITLPDNVLIIDSMLEKRYDSSFQGRLVTEYISKTSADQRKGRTGRTSKGICYRMVKKDTYEMFQLEKMEEIYLVDLSQYILSLASVGVSPLEILPQGVRYKLKPLITTLKDLGLIKLDNNISEMGLSFINFNLDVKTYAVLWWLLQTTGDVYDGILVVSIIRSLNHPLLRIEVERKNNTAEFFSELKRFKDRWYGKFIGRSDLHTYINILKTYYVYSGRYLTTSGLQDFSNENKLDARVFGSIVSTVEELILKLKTMGYYVSIPSIEEIHTADDIVNLMRPILRRVYSGEELILSSPEKKLYMANHNGKKKTFYSLDTISKLNTYDAEPPPRLLAIKSRADPKGFNRITFSVNIERYDFDTKLITDVRIIKDYPYKMPQRSKRTVSEVIDVVIPFEIDTNAIGIPAEVYPRSMEQEYIPIGKSKKISLL